MSQILPHQRFLVRTYTLFFSVCTPFLEASSLFSLLCIVMIGVASFVGHCLQNIMMDHAGARLTRTLRADVFRHLLHLEVGFYDEDGHSLGALTSRLASDVADVTMMVSRAWGDVAQFVAYVHY